ncbi:exosome complex component Rrp43p [Trichomonascus vanleenenianus]|uniref:exosome non-catalytic core subunit RRP43 n=1 Tax=Trichomonascus vanleenenianus TaxID=2268995 RepID=UPI003ECA323A
MSEHPLSFPPDVFARLEPDIYLQRHLALGLRPDGLRKFDEFRPTAYQLGTLKSDNVLGSSVAKAGGTVVVCGVTASITETPGAGGVYPNVEILRGSSRNAPPTEEEMIMSQRAYQILDAIPELRDQFNYAIEGVEDKWIVLHVRVQVLSRTGPCFDSVWNGIIAALRDTNRPIIEIDPDTLKIKCTIDKENKFFSIPLEQISSSFGVAEVSSLDGKMNGNEEDVDMDHPEKVILADLDGTTEEACVTSRVNVVRSGDMLTSVSICIAGSTDIGSTASLSLNRQDILAIFARAKENVSTQSSLMN